MKFRMNNFHLAMIGSPRFRIIKSAAGCVKVVTGLKAASDPQAAEGTFSQAGVRIVDVCYRWRLWAN